MAHPKITASAMAATDSSGHSAIKAERKIAKTEFIPMLAKSAIQAPVTALIARLIFIIFSCINCLLITVKKTQQRKL